MTTETITTPTNPAAAAAPTFVVAVAHSQDVDSTRAAQELVAQLEAGLADRTPRAALLYAGIDHDHAAVLGALGRRWPGLALIGCTTDGESSSVEEFQEDSLTVVVFAGDGVPIAAGLGRDVSRDPAAATRAAVEHARTALSCEPTLCVTTPESLTTSAVGIIAGLRDALGTTFPILGGVAGDQWRSVRTFQFFGTDVLSDACPVLLFGGPLKFSVGVSSGWRPIGRPSTVTRVDGNIVREIDGRPAADYYRGYLGDQIGSALSSGVFLGEYPLAVTDPADGQRQYLRAPFAIDPESGAMTFVADVPLGATVQLTEAQRDDILRASRVSVEEARQSYPGDSPAAALFFSCAARKQILGTRTAQEARLLRESLDPAIPMCGFYAYGEIGPFRPGAVSHFHNETFVTLLLGVD